MKDIKLKSGRIVTHSTNAQGAHVATMKDGGEMSDAEWTEYATKVRAQRTREIKAAQKARKADSLAAARRDGIIK